MFLIVLGIFIVFSIIWSVTSKSFHIWGNKNERGRTLHWTDRLHLSQYNVRPFGVSMGNAHEPVARYPFTIRL